MTVATLTSAGPRRRGRTAPQSGAEPAIKLAFVVGLIFMFSAFVRQLAMSEDGSQFTNSPIMQVIGVSCTVFGLTLHLTSQKALGILQQCKPILFLLLCGFGSAAWSVNPQGTIRYGILYLGTNLFALALASRYPPHECLRLLLRTMVLACLLSCVWVIIFPLEAVHQATESVQFQHAGLWRGIFSHKQSLGVFAGLTVGLLLFYGSLAFPSLLSRIGAIGCSFACLWGSQSATGFITSIVMPIMLYASYWIARRAPHARRSMIKLFIVVLLILSIGIYEGIFNSAAELFGKSSDLTGRDIYTPILLQGVVDLGRGWFGGGYAGGLESLYAEGIPVDSGFVGKIIEFGYVGSSVIFAIFASVILSGLKLLERTSEEQAIIDVFPASVTAVVLFTNITEYNLMAAKSIGTILVAFAVSLTVQGRIAAVARMRQKNSTSAAPTRRFR